MAAAAGQGKPVSRALVSEFVGLSREEQAWEIQSVLLREGAPGALRKLNDPKMIKQPLKTLRKQ